MPVFKGVLSDVGQIISYTYPTPQLLTEMPCASDRDALQSPCKQKFSIYTRHLYDSQKASARLVQGISTTGRQHKTRKKVAGKSEKGGGFLRLCCHLSHIFSREFEGLPYLKSDFTLTKARLWCLQRTGKVTPERCRMQDKDNKKVWRNETVHTKKSPGSLLNRGPLYKRRRPPSLPHCIAVPSAQAGLTSLFGMGRGGTPLQ